MRHLRMFPPGTESMLEQASADAAALYPQVQAIIDLCMATDAYQQARGYSDLERYQADRDYARRLTAGQWKVVTNTLNLAFAAKQQLAALDETLTTLAALGPTLTRYHRLLGALAPCEPDDLDFDPSDIDVPAWLADAPAPEENEVTV